MAITARPSQDGLHLLVDSTGVKMLGEGEWKTRKHGADYRRQWRKVHLGVDVQTLEIQAIEITDNAIGDAPVMPQLLAQIPEDELLCSVSADGAYDIKACREAKSSSTRHSHYSNAQKCQALGREPSGSSSEKRHIESDQGAGTFDLEEMERLPPTQLGGDQDGLLHKTG